MSAEPPVTLTVSAYPQRMSDRYTTRDGLPGKRVTAIRIEGQTVTAQTEAGPATFAEGKWKPGGAQNGATPGISAAESGLLPAGAKVWSAARTPDGRAWVVTDRGAFVVANGKASPVSKPTSYLTQQPFVYVDAVFSCVAADRRGQVWLGTNAGLYATDGKNWWNPINGSAGLPYEVVTCLAFGPDGALWVGTTEGVCRYTAEGNWQYYWGQRWLPENRVNAIAVAPDGAAWVATEGGVARLYDRRMTLAEKAAHYERITAARHNRRGFVTGCTLKTPGDVNGGFIHEASDNDGLWTALYLAAEAFRYGATKDPEARRLAQKSMRAMLDLVKYSGVSGFPARAIFNKGEEILGYDADETVRVDGEPDKIWYASPVDPKVMCKGDTSSDELDGHYLAWYLYHDLVADAAEKKEIAAVARAVTDNILDHALTLVGPTGRKTRWGVWHPKYINDDPMWWEERGLNSLEILAFLKVAEHLCGDARYTAKYNELIREHHYLLNTVTQKVAEPWWSVNHSDDEMAFMVYYALMRLEKDPDTRRVLLQSLERSWKIERPEASPFFNFTYGALTGRPCDAEASVQTLQDWPWELVDWEMRGTHRADVQLLRTTRQTRSRAQTVEALPASERRLMKWNGNPYQCDGGGNGGGEEDGGAWLLPYWMGRYHNLIAERSK